MKCPACANELTAWTADGLEVDVCSGGCGGLWFDNHELRKVDAKAEHLGEPLLAVELKPGAAVDRAARRDCPKCDSTVMMRHFYNVKRDVEVDECPRCGGVWLDEGELRLIRDQYETDDARSRAAESYFDDIFGVELERMRGESAEREEKAHRIARAFRFISPSYYIPGKQRWGAF